MRADRLLVARGMFESRARAQAAIDAGLVSADGRLVRKASQEIAERARIEASAPHPFVSRGGVKLAHALEHFGLSPKGSVCLDVGASTGGFTDVLLGAGASRVYAVDTGHGQLHRSLADHPGVVSMESTDARRLTPDMFGEPIGFITIDASFISLRLLMPHVLPLGAPGASLIALIKPQFEVGRARLGKNGIVTDEALYAPLCAGIADEIVAAGWSVRPVAPSPIAGGDGNREFLLAATRPAVSG